jgi:hypothetical protein
MNKNEITKEIVSEVEHNVDQIDLRLKVIERLLDIKFESVEYTFLKNDDQRLLHTVLNIKEIPKFLLED